MFSQGNFQAENIAKRLAELKVKSFRLVLQCVLLPLWCCHDNGIDQNG